MILGISFDYIWLLPLAVILPALAVWVLHQAFRQRKARLERLGNMEVVARLIPTNTLVPPGWRMARLGGASALLGICVAGPRWARSAVSCGRAASTWCSRSTPRCR